MRRLVILLPLVLLFGSTATAQVVDSTAQEPDSLGYEQDRAGERADPVAFGPMQGVRDPVGYESEQDGYALTDSIPALLPALDLADILQQAPGAFTYMFDAEGWPDGWSPDGLPPQSAGLTLNGIPFDHLFTGRPAFALIPLSLLERPRLQVVGHGRPMSVQTRIRPFATPIPITEGTYWRGGDGLQSITAVHAQHRRRTVLGEPGFLNVMGSYGGRAADGGYPNSDLRRGRQVVLRVGYEQRDWSIQLINLHNRRQVGAHGGVVPDPGNFESIYRRAAAVVEDPEARRRTIRNDLALTLRSRMLGPEPITIGAFWTAETQRYNGGDALLETVSDRLGIRAAVPLLAGSTHALSARAVFWSDVISPRHGFIAEPVRLNRIHAYLQDSLRTGRLRLQATAGLDRHGGSVRPSASTAIETAGGPLALRASIALTNRPVSAVDRLGFGSLTGLRDVESAGRLLHGRGSIHYRTGPIDLTLGAFAAFEEHSVDYFATGSDSATVRLIPGSLRRAGTYAEIAWRRDALRGFYWIASPTLLRFLNAGASELHARTAEALPQMYGRMRLGARYVLFRGDLDLDVYAQATAWSELRGRIFLPESGLLAISARDALILGPSSMLDLVVEARVRDARIFLTYENALSGTQLMVGNMIVPVYPLPARRFRFGVYWPIFG